MRSLLQFLAFASSTVCALLFTGIALTASARADATNPAAGSCYWCCDCTSSVPECSLYSGGGSDCQGFNCGDCTCKNIGPLYYCVL